MKITEEISITEFKPWSGAVYTKERIIEEDKVDEFDSLIEEVYPDGLTSTELNDLLWFDSDWIYEMIGISEEGSEEDEDDEELEDLLDEELKDSNKKILDEEILTNEEKEYLKKEIDRIVDKSIYNPLFYKISGLELNITPNLNHNAMSIHFKKSALGDAGVSEIWFEVDSNLFKGMKNRQIYTLEELGLYTTKNKVKDNEEDEGAIISEPISVIDYNKKYNLNDPNTLTEVAMNLYYDDDFKENDLFYLVNSNYIDKAIKIPYKTKIAIAWTYDHYGNDPDADAEFEEVDFMYPLTDDDDDYLTPDVIKKYTLELAGSDRVITANELLKRNSKEKVIKFIKENNIIPEDIIEEKAQEYYEKEYGTARDRYRGYEFIRFNDYED